MNNFNSSLINLFYFPLSWILIVPQLIGYYKKAFVLKLNGVEVEFKIITLYYLFILDLLFYWFVNLIFF